MAGEVLPSSSAHTARAPGLRAAGGSQVPGNADTGGPVHEPPAESSDSRHRHAGHFREWFPSRPAMTAQRRSATMTTQRLFATVALGLFLGFPGPAKAQYHLPRSTCPDRPGPQSTATARTRLRESSMMRTATRMGSCLARASSRDRCTRRNFYQCQRDQRQRRDLRNLHRCRRHIPRLFPKQGRLHHARPARLDPHSGRVPQRAGPGRGSLSRCQPDASRLHLEQGCLHHVRRARLRRHL